MLLLYIELLRLLLLDTHLLILLAWSLGWTGKVSQASDPLSLVRLIFQILAVGLLKVSYCLELRILLCLSILGWITSICGLKWLTSIITEVSTQLEQLLKV